MVAQYRNSADFTFDCGVIALGPSGSACYWTADEV